MLLLRLSRATALLMMLAGGTYVGGALGLELLGGVFAEAHGMQSPIYLAVAIAEERLEIAGLRCSSLRFSSTSDLGPVAASMCT